MAFFLSGLYHYVAGRVALPSEQFHGTLQFFALQPCLVLFEDTAMSFAKQYLGMTSSGWRLLGYLWTFSVLTFTAPGFIEDCIKMIPTWSVFPFSLADKVLPASI